VVQHEVAKATFYNYHMVDFMIRHEGRGDDAHTMAFHAGG